MKNENRKMKIVSAISLFFALMLIISFSWYSINRQNEENHSKEKKELLSGNIVKNQQNNVPEIVVKDTAGLLKVDSIAYVSAREIPDSSNNSVLKMKAKKVNIHKEITKETLTQIEERAGETPSSTEEKNGKWKIIIKNGMIYVYPNGKWSNAFIAYPASAANKEKQHVLQPDFPGVVYLTATNGDINVHNEKYNVVIEKFTASEPSSKMPFFLSLKYNHDFLIFGTYEDSNNWYIYKNNEVSVYEPATSSENVFSLNSK